jgi:1-acyl-sn-glycerol-3-phosphate acyltransferase
MMQWISRKLLQWYGWKLFPWKEDFPKCVICVAPHTSNWDFVVGKLFYNAVGKNAKFLIKKEWFVFPMNLIFKAWGGVPIDRSHHQSVTEQMIEQFNAREKFQLAITPEGTRKKVDEWKKGFYYIALGAKVPILIAFFDYAKKEVGFKGVFYPTGNAEADIQTIRGFYADVNAHNPDNF